MNKNRKGSALLVVLGMLSFMVISAVAFSAYMRYSRLPSSFLRQASASRQLAKAAVAEAIDEIDAAIGNMPHPGLWNRQNDLTATENRYYYPRRPSHLASGMNVDDLRQNRNIWMDRVYIGNSGDKDEADVRRHLVEPEAPANGVVDDDDNVGTVSPLCLEALAYIPPPLVNAARYYSRRSNAAKWHQMAFDAGRFAFCALDVSDYFDVNAVAANVGRSSSSAGRISLAHVFEKPETSEDDPAAHTGYVMPPQQWDQFMQKFRTMSAAEAEARGQKKNADLSKVPLVSVADLNLALYDGGLPDFAPFCQYVDNNEASLFSSSDDKGVSGQANLAMATFVTDGLYPSVVTSAAESGDEQDLLDLADANNQPFRLGAGAGPAGNSFQQARQGVGEGGDRIRKHISGLGMATLYDYLDEDNVPISLSIPQVERTPMVCGIEPKINGASVEISAKTDPENLEEIRKDGYGNIENKQEKTRTVKYFKNYKLDADKFSRALSASLKTVVAYPFHRGVDVDSPDSFKVDGHLAVYLATGDFRFRTMSNNDLLHLTDSNKGSALGTKEAATKDGNALIGVFHAQVGKNTPFTLPGVNPATEGETVKSIELNGEMDAAQTVRNALDSTPILTITYRQRQEAQVDEDGKVIPGAQWNNVGEPVVIDAVCNIRPVGENGKYDDRFAQTGEPLVKTLTDGIQVSVRAAVWVRVRNGADETVDLVPACLYDDKLLLNADNASSDPAACDDLGSAYPLMLFPGGSFRFAIGDTEGSFDKFTPVELDFKASSAGRGVMCLDPRWNWAPEHWFATDSVDENSWLTKVHSFMETQQGCDRDIFMATSDAGYLQSVYELAFLPRLISVTKRLGDETSGSDYTTRGDFKSPSEANATLKDWAIDPTAVRNVNLMWRTYRPYKVSSGLENDKFEEFRIVNQGSGVKVNPYSDDTNVVMAVFANTPFDWWAASTNVQTGVQQNIRCNAAEFNKKFAFSNINGNNDAKFVWKDLKRVARNFMIRLREGLKSDSSYSWEDAYDWLDWSGMLGHPSGFEDYFCTPQGGGGDYDSNQLDGQTVPLWGVDRKFLYGYWRDCFGVQQQLFLIFVRAEPSMMGGGAIGQTPPALGAKAVALVWRDPTESREDCGNGGQPRPHRTRILFYRQFE